jgi:alpha-L-fucosidase 2
MNFFTRFFGAILSILIVAAVNTGVSAQTKDAKQKEQVVQGLVDVKHKLDTYNVSWDTPGPTSSASMPVGNGDIGLNVWVNPTGELNFYIGKTDAWGQDIKGAKGLMKVGAVRVALSPNPLTAGSPFLQVLKLHEGEILIKEGAGAKAVQLRVWVDANHPVIRVETKSQQPVALNVTLNDWRLHTGEGDAVISGKNNITWYHRNPATAEKHVAGLTFGAVIKGSGLTSKNDTTLQSGAANTHVVSVYPLTAQTSLNEWHKRLDKNVAAIDKLPVQQTRKAHEQWWDNFWHRSWIFFGGDETAAKVNQGYALQRFVTACAGRGTYPIKFNGSVFVVDNNELRQGGSKNTISVNADYRTWGGQYWFQNTRAMYWPMLQQGNFDMLMPMFKMYAQETINNKTQVQGYYHHDGSYFAETASFYGGLRYWGPEVKEDWTGHYFTPILELSMMMLDYYEYTGDKKFVKETLVPMATEGLEFFDKHFSRDANGKLLLDPDNAIEQYWKVHNPAPDIAGLYAITTRMLALPSDLTDETSRANWRRLRSELPELPKGTRNGKEVLFPYTTDSLTAKPRNNENPELYAIYPFRLYGLGKPGFQLAVNSFNERLEHTQKGCWVQDPIQAAMLGLTDVAQTYVSFNFQRKDPQLKFPAFWQAANDYAPDEDNGGSGENGLQQMLMQADGKKIMLLPAWPKTWGDVDFKLHAPYNTTVQGKVRGGKLIDLIVIPSSRRKDIVDLSSHQEL